MAVEKASGELRRPSLLWIAVVLWAFISLPFFVESGGQSRLKVHIPQSLKNANPNGYYDHRDSMFGIPPYGGSIVQPLYYAESVFCTAPDRHHSEDHYYPDDRSDDDDNKNAFRQTPIRYYPSNPQKAANSPFFLMVDRGGCSFVKKVRNAQYMGAAGVLIADNVCHCKDEQCMKKTHSITCDSREPTMADDGSGSDITIPSFLISKHDAEAFKEYIRTFGQAMRVEMEFPVPAAASTVQDTVVVPYDLWISPSADLSLTTEFLSRFRPAARALASQTNFSPHYFIYGGTNYSCYKSIDHTNPCSSMCTNEGRYCVFNGVTVAQLGDAGANVVKESLRQLCIFSTYGKSDPDVWWNYVNEFQRSCASNKAFASETCIQHVYKTMTTSMSAQVVDRCISNSGGFDEGTNNKLDAEIALADQRGIYVTPTLLINNLPYSGPLKADAVFGTICSEFPRASMPPICIQCASCPDSIGCIENSGTCPLSTVLSFNFTKSKTSVSLPQQQQQISRRSEVSFFTFLSSIILLITFMTLIAVVHRIHTRDEIRERVRIIMADYMLLSDNEDV